MSRFSILMSVLVVAAALKSEARMHDSGQITRKLQQTTGGLSAEGSANTGGAAGANKVSTATVTLAADPLTLGLGGATLASGSGAGFGVGNQQFEFGRQLQQLPRLSAGGSAIGGATYGIGSVSGAAAASSSLTFPTPQQLVYGAGASASFGTYAAGVNVKGLVGK